MFVQSVIASIVILIGCNAAVWCRKWWLSLPMLGFGILSCPFLVTVVCNQSLFTLPCLLLILIPKAGRPLFTIASIAALAFAYWSLFDAAEKKTERYEELREKYPFVSMASRVPEPKSHGNLTTEQSVQLDKLENNLIGALPHPSRSYLRKLHDDRVEQFVGRPGFGFDRMGSVTEESIKWELGYRENQESKKQPVMPLPSNDPAGELLISGSLDGTLSRLHEHSVYDFVNPVGFGYVKSRTQVSGFQSHRFSEVPKSQTGWSVNSVELVGVLVHDTPAVYLSEHLPRMDELKGAKTKPLDVFEKEGLAELEKGEELFVRGKDDSARMMGAIRNAKQCVECHGGQRGDLLGAFSYRLKK